jgi:serine/threonine-protein kinase ATR
LPFLHPHLGLQAESAALADDSLDKQLAHLLSGIKHDSAQVRRLALARLARLLRDRCHQLCRILLNEEQASRTIVSSLVEALVGVCRQHDSQLRELACECLGLVGAVDPARLVDPAGSEGLADRPRAGTSLYSEEIGAELIGAHLARIYLSSEDAKAQDKVALAVQQVLRIYECQSYLSVELGSDSVSPHAPLGEHLWWRLDPAVREIVHPFLTSSYSMTQRMGPPTFKNIFASRGDLSFKGWLGAWLSEIIAQSIPLRTTANEKLLALFEALRNVSRDDLDCGLFVLPHVVLFLLTSGTDQHRTCLCSEVMQVLEAAAADTNVATRTQGETVRMAVRTVFSLVDLLFSFFRTKSSSKRRDPAEADRKQQVQIFLSLIPDNVVAHAAYNCGEYARALMHIERHVRDETLHVDATRLEQNLPFLQKIYQSLGEPGGVAGVAKLRKDTSLDERIVDHRAAGRWAQSLTCYEVALQQHPDNLAYHIGLLQSQLELGHYETAMMQATGSIHRFAAWEKHLNGLRMKAAWRLGKWTELSSFVQADSELSFDVSMGRLLDCTLQGHTVGFSAHLSAARDVIGREIAAVATGSNFAAIGKFYDHFIQLQMLQELESVATALMADAAGEGSVGAHGNTSVILAGLKAAAGARMSDESGKPRHMDPDAFDRLCARIDGPLARDRLSATLPTVQAREPLLALRRILLSLCADRLPAGEESKARLVTAISENWLNSARLAREANLLQASFSAILQAGHANALSLSIEKARLQWAQGERHEALMGLQAELQRVEDSERTRREYAEAMLLVGDWMSETQLVQSDAVIQQYKKVIDLQPDWEHGYFSLACYYDRLLEFDATKRASKEATTLPHVISNYGRSLKCGNTYIVRALPRLLTLWLDYGERFVERNQGNARLETLTTINQHVTEFCDTLPPYQFYTVISQLSSRIMHGNPSVYNVIERILARLLEAFPQQAVWLLMAVFRSENASRRKRCGDLFNKAKRQVRARVREWRWVDEVGVGVRWWIQCVLVWVWGCGCGGVGVCVCVLVCGYGWVWV